MLKRYNLFSKVQTKTSKNKAFPNQKYSFSDIYPNQNFYFAFHFQTKNTQSRCISKPKVQPFSLKQLSKWIRKCSNSIGVWARTFARSKSNISGAQTSWKDWALICVRNFHKQRDFHGLISIKYENGICSILHKLNFCTQLVQNYKRWIMQQPQC